MDRGKFFICMVFVFSLGIGGDRSVEAQNSQTYNECFMPDVNNVNCISIMNCTALLYLVEHRGHNSTIATYLRNAVCGHEKEFPYYPKVCCPYADESDPEVKTDYSTISTVKLPSQDICGRSDVDYIPAEGGGIAQSGAWPWIVALGYINLNARDPHYEWMCAGTLISDRFVLTSSHCTIGIGMYRLLVVRLGDLNLNPTVKDGANPIDIDISHVIRHEQHNAEELTNDIALLKLAYSVSFSQYIRPICLPISSNHRANPFIGSETIIAGWGSTMLNPSTDDLLDVEVNVIANSECAKKYINNSIVIGNTHLCAGIIGTEICRGDSGGPLMWKSDSQYYLVGVVNFGHTNCGASEFPAVFARVTSFVQWITDNMNYN